MSDLIVKDEDGKQRLVLYDDLVNYIRKSNKSSYKLAKELKVDPSTIRDVRNNKTWRHIV